MVVARAVARAEMVMGGIGSGNGGGVGSGGGRGDDGGKEGAEIEKN
jgi:hypothetical protein